MISEREAQKLRAVIDAAVSKLRKMEKHELASELKERSGMLPEK
jgi:hypothetical protein